MVAGKLSPDEFVRFLDLLCDYFVRFGLEQDLQTTQEIKSLLEAGDTNALKAVHADLATRREYHGSGLLSVCDRLGWFLE